MQQQLNMEIGQKIGKSDFENFHENNPRVYELFILFTSRVIGRGFKHYSADAIVHRIRWETGVETRGDEFKLNNNYISAYARMFERDFPQYQGFFRKRQSKYD